MSSNNDSVMCIESGELFHGLQVLGSAGLTRRIWRRLRLDPQFLKSAMAALANLYRSPPRDSIVFDHSMQMTRMDMIGAIRDLGIEGPTDDQVKSLSGHHYTRGAPALGRLKYYIVRPGYSLDAFDVREELRCRGLAPANTEDALLLVLITRLVGFTGKMLAIDSSLGLPGNQQYLCLDSSEGPARITISSESHKDFPGDAVYLAKPITPKIAEAMAHVS